MTAAERKQAIADYIKTAKPAMTGIKIMYHGERTPFEAYNIPLDLLVYNPYNGRIGSIVKSYEKQNHRTIDNTILLRVSICRISLKKTNQ